MSDRQVVVANDAEGNSWWFPLSEAEPWAGTTMQGGELYRVFGRWVLMDQHAELFGKSGTIIDDEGALAWLLRNGYKPPCELAECADKRKLR